MLYQLMVISAQFQSIITQELEKQRENPWKKPEHRDQ